MKQHVWNPIREIALLCSIVNVHLYAQSPQPSPTAHNQEAVQNTQILQKEALQTPEISSTGPNTETTENIGTQGNWVKKREWLIQANEVNKEIQDLTLKNEEIRKMFLEKHHQVEIILENYFKDLNLDQGKMQQMFDSVYRYLEEKKKKDIEAIGFSESNKVDPELQVKAEVVENDIKESSRLLEQLKLDMKSIDDLDQSLVDRLKRLDEYLDSIVEESDKAEAVTNSLWKIIDHDIARDRYYELKNVILEKIKNTQNFLQDDLAKDFDSVVNTMKSQMNQTQDLIKKLEDKGFFIKDRWRRIKELLLKEKEKEAEKKSLEEKILVEAKLQTPQKQTAWYDSLYTMIKSIKDSIVGLFARTPAKPTPDKIAQTPPKPESKEQTK